MSGYKIPKGFKEEESYIFLFMFKLLPETMFRCISHTCDNRERISKQAGISHLVYRANSDPWPSRLNWPCPHFLDKPVLVNFMQLTPDVKDTWYTGVTL